MLLSFLYGCGTGYTQGATPIFESVRAPFNVTKSDISWMGSISFTSSAVSVIICFFYGNKLGRKWFLLASILVYLLIWATFLFTSSSIIIIIGLGLYGISSSMHNIMGYVYIGEVASPQNREILGISYGFSLLLGIEVEFLISSFDSYRLLIIFPLVVTVLTLLPLIFTMRESPYYLLSKNKNAEALTIYAWLRAETEEDVRPDFDNMVKYVQGPKTKGTFSEMFKPENLKILGLMVYLYGSVFVNSGSIVQQYGQKVMENFSKFMNLTIFVTLFNVTSILGAISGLFITKIAGRKVLLLMGFLLVVLAQALIGISYFIEDYNKNEIVFLAYIIGGLHCLSFFVGTVSTRPGIVILRTEIFPATLKEFFSSLLVFTNYWIRFGVVKSYGPLSDNIGIGWVNIFYAVVNSINLLLVAIFVHDTKNKSLYQIQNDIQKKGSK